MEYIMMDSATVDLYVIRWFFPTIFSLVKKWKDIDLSKWYGDKKKKKVSARGIIDILKRYNIYVVAL